MQGKFSKSFPNIYIQEMWKSERPILNFCKIAKKSSQRYGPFLCVSINFTKRNEMAYIKMFLGRRFANVNIPAGSSAGFSAVVSNSFPAFRWAKRWCDFVGRARPAIQDDNSRSSGVPELVESRFAPRDA